MRITKFKLVAFVAFVGAASGGGVPAVVASVAAPTCTADPASVVPGTTEDEKDVLRIVYQVGTSHCASDKVMLAAFEACTVESGCRNLKHGDRDSLGVFQQRPSQGWGTPAQLTDVRYAATQFFVRAIASEGCCPTAGLLAQAVQRSCCPHKYDQHEATARERMAEGARLSGVIP